MDAHQFRITAIVAALLVLGLFPVFAKVNVDTIVTHVGGTLEWDPYLGYGAIVVGPNQLTFEPGRSWGFLNERRMIRLGQVSRGPNGTIEFSETGAHAIESALALPVAPAAATATRPQIAAIIIDPGHGGKDPGTIHDPFNTATHHLMEKNIVLAVGLAVDKRLRKHFPHMKIVMTRRTDTFVSLAKRTEIANAIKLKKNQAKIFVSIHANASFDPAANGFEVWYLPPTYQRDVIDPTTLAKSGRQIYPLLNAMKEEEYTVQSSLLGEDILEGMAKVVGNDETNRGLKAQTWYVVRNSKMPAVLVEVGFVSNRTEAKLLGTSAYLDKLAQGIYLGIVDFVDHFDAPTKDDLK
jgi:N-acetylmuramoyl-L-alanine amidase